MDIQTVTSSRPGLKIETWSDDVYPHYLLCGERFNEQDILLNLMIKHTGACRAHHIGADMDLECHMDCQSCKHSIYHEVGMEKVAFIKKTQLICHRVPKAGDEWEVNLVMRKGRIPKFQTFFWTAEKTLIDGEIIDIIFDTIRDNAPQLFANAQLCYVKIRRFDMEKPLDASFAANEMLKEMAKDAGIALGIN